MKLSKIITAAAVAAMALMAFASTASATTLSVGGVKQNKAVTIEATIKSGGSALLTDTAGFAANTCTSSTVKGSTTSFTSAGTAPIGGPLSTLSFSGCTEGNPTVDAAGSLTVEWIKGTTNGTVRSNGAKVTVPSFFGTLTCTTSNTDVGTLTGVAAGNATFDINAVLSCTVISTAKWSGTYTVTSPAGLGVEE
jgi:hypothetical protein